MFKIICFTINTICILIISSSTVRAEIPQLPSEWIANPEDNPSQFSVQFFPWSLQNRMEKLVTKVYDANRSSIEFASDKKSVMVSAPNIPNWTPWHLEVFTTELSVLTSGRIGVLTAKGTATAQAYWRRQGPVPSNTPNASNTPNILNSTSTINAESNEAGINQIPTVNIEDINDENSLKKELEPMIKSALASGKIKDESVFRKNLEQAATEFYLLTNKVDNNPGLGWWISGLRFDLIVAASGRLAPAPVISVGGEVRLRFDWRRITKNSPTLLAKKLPKESILFPGNFEKTQTEFQNFIFTLSNDLNQAFSENYESKGFKPYSLRVGLGFSANGNVGIAKASATAFAQVNFSRDQQAPRINPRNLALNSSLPKISNSSSKYSSIPLLLIEQNPTENHILFAKSNNITFDMNPDKSSAYYQLEHERFRKGLIKAIKMGRFFTSAGHNADSAKWKLYQMKISFDLSISGTASLTTFSGIKTAEMAFYNMNF